LLHDLTVDEKYYEDINHWNSLAASKEEKNPEVQKYRNHPSEAANLVLSMKNLPPDVDQIILQHHETQDGGGFPRRLPASRITPMATVFIITEDLIQFIGNSSDPVERVDLFLKDRQGVYTSGNFKKVFDALKDSIHKCRI
jgi:hypothetical protein